MASIEMVAVLITDLVGSTALESAVGPELAESLRDEHFGMLRAAIAAAGGREIKTLGDGVMAAFDAAASAVECAVSMQQRLEVRNRRAEHDMVLRVGISAGDATPQDGDYFGLPVIEAARLCAWASGGQVLLSDLTRAMVGRRGGHRFIPVGDLELKGLSQPLAACELTWYPLPAVRAPLPGRLQVVAPTSFVGRRSQQELLTTMRKRAESGDRQVALLAGEPGIGKTRLATHAALAAHHDGALVLYGHCDEDFNVPYQPWAEALTHLVEHASLEILEAHVRSHGSEVARLVPLLAERIPALPPLRDSDPETERFVLFSAIRALVQSAAAVDPVVLLVDDVHWADRPSLSLLKHVVAAGGPMRLLVLATYRDSDIVAGHPLPGLLADLRREAGVEWIGLDGLDSAEVVALMEAAAGHDLDTGGAALADAITRDTDGNPFFVGELLRHLLESGAVIQGEDGRYVVRDDFAAVGLPGSVRDVILSRIARLGEPAVKALSLASVIGREFDLELLARSADVEEDKLLDVLEATVGGSVLRESATVAGRFAFAHALFNQTLYEDLGRTRRIRLHRCVAEALEVICGDEPTDRLAELAHQWSYATEPDGICKAVDYALRAGVHALDSLAPADGLIWFDQALDRLGMLPDPDQGLCCELLIRRGEAQKQSSDGSYRETLLDASRIAQEIGDIDLMTRAALHNGRGIWSATGGIDDERVAVLRTVVAALPPGDAHRAQILGRLALELEFAGDFEGSVRPLIDEALLLARASGDPRVLTSVLGSVVGVLSSQLDLLDERRAMIDEMCLLAEQTADPYARCLASFWGFALALDRGDLAEIDANLTRLQIVSDTICQPAFRLYAAICGSSRAMLAGDLEQAAVLADDGLRIVNDGGHPEGLAVYAAQVALQRLEQDRVGETIELFEEAVKSMPGFPALDASLVQLYSEVGRLDDARVLLDAAAPGSFASVPDDLTRLIMLTLYGYGACVTGAIDHAVVLYDLLHPYRDRVINSIAAVWGSADLILGRLATVLERYDVAADHFESAEAVHNNLQAPFLLARTWLWWGEMLVRRGGHDNVQRAVELLRRSRTTAAAHGGAASVHRADALLAQLAG